jgi:uncharacterized membrane protein required for colicin V production
MINALDLVIIVIILLCVYAGYKKGLILTLFRLVSFFVTIYLANRLYPYVSRYLMQTALYDNLRDWVIRSMGLGSFVREHTARQSAEVINSLPLPGVLKELLLSNNTPDMYDFLHVQTVEEYVGGFFANMALNILSLLVVFMLVWVLLQLIGNLLNIINHLPVIGSLNRAGGLAMGFVLGIIISWIGLTLMSLLFATPANPWLYDWVQGSWAAGWLYNNNWMLPLVTGV